MIFNMNSCIVCISQFFASRCLFCLRILALALLKARVARYKKEKKKLHAADMCAFINCNVCAVSTVSRESCPHTNTHSWSRSYSCCVITKWNRQARFNANAPMSTLVLSASPSRPCVICVLEYLIGATVAHRLQPS